MNNQALRDKLFAALRGDALPQLKELDDLVLADIDKIMPIVEEWLVGGRLRRIEATELGVLLIRWDGVQEFFINTSKFPC